MADDFKFCYKCGAELPEGSDYCPECGSPLNDSDVKRDQPEYVAQLVESKSNGLGAIPILMFVYGVIAIFGSIMFMMTGLLLDMIIQTLENMVEQGLISDSDYATFAALFTTMTAEVMKLVLIVEGLLLLLSGISALVSGRYASKLVKFKLCFTLCLLASLLPLGLLPFDVLMGIALPVVGFIICYKIYSSKDMFKD